MFCAQFERCAHFVIAMPVAGTATLMLVAVCANVVQLQPGVVVDAGGPSTAVSARQWLAVSRRQPTDHWNRIALIVPDRQLSTKSGRDAVNSGKRKRHRYAAYC